MNLPSPLAAFTVHVLILPRGSEDRYTAIRRYSPRYGSWLDEPVVYTGEGVVATPEDAGLTRDAVVALLDRQLKDVLPRRDRLIGRGA